MFESFEDWVNRYRIDEGIDELVAKKSEVDKLVPIDKVTFSELKKMNPISQIKLPQAHLPFVGSLRVIESKKDLKEWKDDFKNNFGDGQIGVRKNDQKKPFAIVDNEKYKRRTELEQKGINI